MEIQNIPIGEVMPSAMNPRKTFDEAELKELADNIRQQGLLQPITVRPDAQGIKYEIVCGERRYRAMKILNAEDAQRWPTIAAIVREMTDDEAFDAMITENLQRKDVDPIEEAFAFGQLLEKGSTAEDVALRFGKSVRFVQDRVKLNNLIPELLLKVKEGKMALVAAMIISKFEDEMQRKFLGAYGNYESIGKETARRFVDNMFMTISRASWYQSGNDADKDFDGGCGCKCDECPYNTANANCLFWEMKAKAEDGKCSNRPGFEAKHIAYMMAFLDSYGNDLVRKGDALGYGKTVIIDTANCWNAEGQHVHDEAVKAIAAKGYEIVNPTEMFVNRVYYDYDDERIAPMLNAGEIYRCIDVFAGYSLPAPKIVHYYLKPKSDNDCTAAGEVAPAEVVSLVGKFKRNIEIANENIVKKHSELAGSIGPAKRRGTLCREEQTAFDMFILRSLDNDFFRHHYKLCKDSYINPSVKELKDIATNNADDRDLWYREFVRKQIAIASYPGSVNSLICHDILPIWRRKEYDEIGHKALQALSNKNDKIKAKLEELGYDVHGKKLKNEIETKYEVLEAQQAEMKRKHPDTLILFKVGDFYEALHDDAVALSEILGLTLTKKPAGNDYIDLCGFPHHALDGYLPKIVYAGKRVAICEQTMK
ncbi:MAG: ParB/RepB/Spo0J family partition protein [Muribaculaceae bacterium]|nr:ParB/RepB/Spo0J family partition protein [Muribaculaceae bacterium]